MTRSEALRALAGRHLACGLGHHYVDILLNDDAELLDGFYQHVTCDDLLEIHRVRLDPAGGTLELWEAHPRPHGTVADAIRALFAGPYRAAIGEDLDNTLQRLSRAKVSLTGLALQLRDPECVSGQPEGTDEVRWSCCQAAALVLTRAGTERRAVAEAIAPSWAGTPAQLLAAVDCVVRPSERPGQDDRLPRREAHAHSQE